MKKVLLMLAFLLLPNVLFAGDDYIIIEGERRVFVRLEFFAGSMELNEASERAFAEIAPLLTDGTLRRYEIHGSFCSGIAGSRRNASARTDVVFERLAESGVSENYMTSTLNVAFPTQNRLCPAELRIDVMATDLHREARRPVVQGRRTVAVYMAGDEPQGVRGVHNIIGGELTRAISANPNFLAVDRTDFILAALEDEHDYQRSGMVDDEQIKDLGRQLGVQYMCVSNITAAGAGFYIDTRLVDVETAEVIRSITATSSLRDVNEYMRVARDIARELVEPDRSHRCGAGEDTRYDPVYQFCFGGRAYNFCAGSGYNPRTHACLANNEIGTLCADGSVVQLGTHCGEHTLSVAVAPPVGGSVVRSPDLENYRADQTVTLSAVANRGFEFAGWAGAQSSQEQSINVTMIRDMPVIALFRSENNNMLTTTAFPAEGGTVLRTPDYDEYSSNETVTVRAIPNSGFEFVGWQGATSDTSSTIEILMNEGKALVAIFRPHLHTLNAIAMPNFGGSVFINGTALTEVSTSEFGNFVEVLAQPAPGFEFMGWAGETESSDNPLTIDLTSSNAEVIAIFVSAHIDDETESTILAIGGDALDVSAGAGINVNDVETRHALSLPEHATVDVSQTSITPPLLPEQHAPRTSRLKLSLRVSSAALAVGGIVGGIIYNGMVEDEYQKYYNYNSESDVPEIVNSRQNAEDYMSIRNVLYILGGVGLAGFVLTFTF